MASTEDRSEPSSGGHQRPGRSGRRPRIGTTLVRGVVAGSFAVMAVLAATTSVVDAASLPVVVPGLARIVEGDAGTQVLEIPVTLSEASTETVTAQWETIFGPHVQPPAPATPGVDFTAASGTVTFAPGTTTATIAITVHGDLAPEPDEWIVVSFHHATNATIGGYWGLGFGVIEDDDTPPVMRITNGARVVEGDTGTQTLSIPVTLSRPSWRTVTASWATLPLGDDEPPFATEHVDYEATSGTLTFAPGVTTAFAEVTVLGDTVPEPDELVTIQLFDPFNATLGPTIFDSVGYGIIVNDD